MYKVHFLWSGSPIDSILAQVSNKVCQIGPRAIFLSKTLVDILSKFSVMEPLFTIL